jgi:hypothetical protein
MTMVSLGKSPLLLKPNVRFSAVQLREYKVTIGDHPLTTMFPLSLDWLHSETETISIEDHIANRMNKLEKRKSACLTANGREAFRLDDANRFARLYYVTGLRKEDLYTMEKARHARIRENNRRAAIGLPPV